MKILLILLLVSQAHAMTAQQAYQNYKKYAAEKQVKEQKMLEDNTKMVIKLIEKGIESTYDNGSCSYDYNSAIDDDLLDFFQVEKVVAYFKKQGYQVKEVEAQHSGDRVPFHSEYNSALFIDFCSEPKQ